MVSLQDKYYGLSVLSWLIILILIVLFYFTLPNISSPKANSVSLVAPVPQASQASQVSQVSQIPTIKENFTHSQNKVKVYNFNTSWCGYSVRFQPEWDVFQEEVNAKGDLTNVQAYDIKCDDPSFEQMCKNYDVPGFPTVIIEKGSDKKVYQGPRTAKSLIETVEKMVN
jgi:thiol-disulfide isomerase/thioredoxin